MKGTPASFKTRFPEFGSVDNARVQMMLDDAALVMGEESRWLNVYNLAHQYYSAHLLAIARHTEKGDIGLVSPRKMQQVDDTTIQNAISDLAVTAEDLFATSYGKRYLSYRQMCFQGIRGV